MWYNAGSTWDSKACAPGQCKKLPNPRNLLHGQNLVKFDGATLEVQKPLNVNYYLQLHEVCILGYQIALNFFLWEWKSSKKQSLPCLDTKSFIEFSIWDIHPVWQYPHSLQQLACHCRATHESQIFFYPSRIAIKSTDPSSLIISSTSIQWICTCKYIRVSGEAVMRKEDY